MPHGTQAKRVATRTSTRPPPFPTSAPCPYRTRTNVFSHYPIRSSKFIRTGTPALPSLIVRIDAFGVRIDVHSVVAQEADEGDAAGVGQFDGQA